MHEREPGRGLGVSGGEGGGRLHIQSSALWCQKKSKKKKSNDVSGHLLKGVLAALGHDEPCWQWLR